MFQVMFCEQIKTSVYVMKAFSVHVDMIGYRKMTE